MNVYSLGKNELQRRRFRVLLLTFFFFFMYSVVVFAGAPSLGDVVYLPFIGFVFVCMMIIFMEFNGDLFHPIFQHIVFALLSNAIVPIVILLSDNDITSLIQNKKTIVIETAIYYTMALVFLYIGYKSPFGLKIEKTFPVFHESFNKQKIIIFIVFCLSAGILSIFFMIQKSGGMLAYLIGISNRTTLFMNYAYLNEVIKLSQFGLYVFFIFCFLKAKKTVYTLPIFLIILFVVLMVNLLTGSRGQLVEILTYLLFIYNYYVKRIKWRNLLIPILLAALLFTLLGDIRTQLGQGILEGKQIELKNSFLKHVAASAEGFTTSAKLIINVPDNTGYYFGKTYLEAPLALIPRILYPDKPVGASWVLNKIIDDNEFNYTTDMNVGISGSGASLFHESFINFGVLGVMVGYFIQGILLRAYYIYICKNSQNKFALLLCVYLINLVTIGESFGHVIKLFSVIFPLLFVYYFARIKSSSASPCRICG